MLSQLRRVFYISAWTVIVALFIITSCRKPSDPVPTPPVLSSDKAITSFVLKAADNTSYLSKDITGTIGNDTIFLTFPPGTVINNLIPSVTFSGKSLTPAGNTAQDFTHPVHYTVTAEDATSKTYFVFVTVTPVSPAYGTVYMGNEDGSLFALDAGTGKLKWKYNSGRDIFASATVHNDLVFDANANGLLFALDTADGSLRWSRNLSSGVGVGATPSFFNGNLYLGCIDGNFYCLDASSGQIRWTYKTDSIIFSSPTVVNGVVYVGCQKNYLYALNASTGNLIWKFSSGIAEDGIDSGPSVVNGVVYAGSLVGNLYAIDAASGTLLWTYSTGPRILINSSPAIAEGMLYFGASDGYLYALDAKTGGQKWKYYLINQTRSSPIVVDGIVYEGSASQHLFAIDAVTGTQKWATRMGINSVSTPTDPVVCDDIVYAGCDDGTVYALNSVDGTIKWIYDTSAGDVGVSGIVASVCVVDAQGKVFHPGNSGEQQ